MDASLNENGASVGTTIVRSHSHRLASSAAAAAAAARRPEREVTAKPETLVRASDVELSEVVLNLGSPFSE